MPIRVLHISAADHGGAGTAAVRLHEALRRAGAESRMIVWSRRGSCGDTSVLKPQPAEAKARRFGARAWYRLTSRRRFFFQNQRLSLDRGTDLVAQAVLFRPDLIVVHYISNFVSFDTIAALQSETGARVAWNLLDMAPLTGGCHYSWECSGYQHGCGSCPALPFRPREDASSQAIRDKRAALLGMDHVVVATSSTLYAQAKSSALFQNAEIQTVLIGVDDTEFPYLDRDEARTRLGIGHEGRILFFGTQKLSEHRKGMKVLVEALARLKPHLRNGASLPLLLVAGNEGGLGGLDEAGYPIHKLGYVDRATLALAYSAADFFVCPSLEDSGPMMVNESMMAGTPVVAFQIGVVPDLVSSGESGIVATEKTADSLAKALAQALLWDSNHLRNARITCRQVAQDKCATDLQAGRFIQIASRIG